MLLRPAPAAGHNRVPSGGVVTPTGLVTRDEFTAAARALAGQCDWFATLPRLTREDAALFAEAGRMLAALADALDAGRARAKAAEAAEAAEATAAARRLALGSRRRLDAGDAPSVGVMHLWLDDIEALANALDAARAEAEHNRVRAEGAELDLAREREAAARLREAMPDAGMLESATLLVSTAAPDSRLWHELSAAAARIRAALAPGEARVCEACGTPDQHSDGLGRWQPCVQSVMDTVAYHEEYDNER